MAKNLSEYGRVRVGDRLTWEPYRPWAREDWTVTRIVFTDDDEIMVEGRGDKHGDAWNDYSRVEEACFEHGTRPGSVGRLSFIFSVLRDHAEHNGFAHLLDELKDEMTLMGLTVVEYDE